jgi:exopolysaccharide production protein ExoQ
MTSTSYTPSNTLTADLRGPWNIPLNSILFVLVLLCFAVGAQFSFIASDNSQLGAIGGSLVFGNTNGVLGSLAKYCIPACCALLVLRCPHRILKLLCSYRVLTLLVALSTISVLWSQDRKSTIIESLLLWLTYGVAMAFSSLSEERQVSIVEWTGVAAVLSTIVIVMYFPQFGINHRQNAGEWQGIFSGKNVCAMEMVFLIMPTLFRFGGSHRWMRSVYIVSAFVVIANSGSRTGWILTIVLLAWASVLRVSRKLDSIGRLLFYAVGTLGLLLLVAFGKLYQNVVLTLIGKNDSLTGRTDIWQALWLSIMKHPLLGYGYRAFWEGMKGESANVMVHIGWVMGYAHNGFLGLWVELGAVGVAVFALSLVLAVRNGLYCILRDRSMGTYWYVTIIFYTVLYNIDEASIMYRFQLVWMLYIVAWVGLARKRESLLAQISSEGRPEQLSPSI